MQRVQPDADPAAGVGCGVTVAPLPVHDRFLGHGPLNHGWIFHDQDGMQRLPPSAFRLATAFAGMSRSYMTMVTARGRAPL